MRHFILLTLLLLGLVLAGGCKEENAYVHVGQNWAAVNELKPTGKTFKVTVETKKTKLQEGDPIAFTVTSERAGRLWVVQVDPKDNMDTLLPNNHTKKNDIEAGEMVSFPPASASWKIFAEPPYGKSIVACVVTTGDTDLSDVLHKGGDKAKSLRLIEQSPAWGVAKLVIEVEKK